MLRKTSAPSSARLWPGVVTALVWCAAAASGVFWALRWMAVDSAQPALAQPAGPTVTAAPSALTSAFLSRAWGVQVAGPAPEQSTLPAARLQLWGVVAGASGRGSALISVDGQPPQAFRVGQTVTEGLVLQSLGPKRAQLGASPPGPALMTLSLPEIGKTP